jgi:hypothetical protein
METSMAIRRVVRSSGGELAGDRPAWRPRGGTQAGALRQIVDLDHGTVNLVEKIVPVLLEPAGAREHGVHPVLACRLPGSQEAPPSQLIDRLVIQGERQLIADVHQLIGEKREGTRGAHRGVLLAQAARGRVTRIGELALAARSLVRVQRVEVLLRQEHLTPHRDTPGGGGPEGRRHVVDGAHVVGDVLADAPVPAGGRLDHLPVVVRDRQRQAVDLRLHDEGQ